MLMITSFCSEPLSCEGEPLLFCKPLKPNPMFLKAFCSEPLMLKLQFVDSCYWTVCSWNKALFFYNILLKTSFLLIVECYLNRVTQLCPPKRNFTSRHWYWAVLWTWTQNDQDDTFCHQWATFFHIYFIVFLSADNSRTTFSFYCNNIRTVNIFDLIYIYSCSSVLL